MRTNVGFGLSRVLRDGLGDGFHYSKFLVSQTHVGCENQGWIAWK